MSTGITALMRLDPERRADVYRVLVMRLVRAVRPEAPRASSNGHACAPAPSPERSPRIGRHVDVERVRGVVVDRVVISTPLDPFLDLGALSEYSGHSRKTLRGLMAREGNALPHYRLTGTGKIVVKRSEFDDFMREFRHTQSALDELIDKRRHERAARRNGTRAS